MTERFVLLREAASKFHAELIAGALKNAGIEAHTDGDKALDEFSMAQHMMGKGVRILVPKARLEEAQAVVAAIDEAAEE